jgi:hypothetical protein
MEDVGIFYGHSVNFVAIWYNLPPFGIFCGSLVYFSLFWYVALRKIWQPCLPADFFRPEMFRNERQARANDKKDRETRSNADFLGTVMYSIKLNNGFSE